MKTVVFFLICLFSCVMSYAQESDSLKLSAFLRRDLRDILMQRIDTLTHQVNALQMTSGLASQALRVAQRKAAAADSAVQFLLLLNRLENRQLTSKDSSLLLPAGDSVLRLSINDDILDYLPYDTGNNALTIKPLIKNYPSLDKLLSLGKLQIDIQENNTQMLIGAPQIVMPPLPPNYNASANKAQQLLQYIYEVAQQCSRAQKSITDYEKRIEPAEISKAETKHKLSPAEKNAFLIELRKKYLQYLTDNCK